MVERRQRQSPPTARLVASEAFLIKSGRGPDKLNHLRIDLSNLLALADWRRRVAEIYADVRRAPDGEREQVWHEWRAARNDLLKNHSQSPLDSEQKTQFRGLPYFTFDPEWRVSGMFHEVSVPKNYDIDLGEDGLIQLKQAGKVEFAVKGHQTSLNIYWISVYGGGLFVPFRDTTNRETTFGGGRYLYDTIKGADLGISFSDLVLDFNYSYNPSCAYHPRWICPLPPAENTLSFPVRAGEKHLR